MVSKELERTDSILIIDHFLKMHMSVKVALKALFTKTERFLLRNNQTFVLNSSSGSSTESSHDSSNSDKDSISMSQSHKTLLMGS